MNEKYLPIKIFEKRKDYDDRSTEGGGDSHESSWVLHGEELNTRVNYLNENIRVVQTSFKKWKQKKRSLPMIISTTVIDKAIAKTHRGRIVNLLENDGRDNVIGVFGDRQILSMVTEEKVLETIGETIGRKEDEATLISSISDIDVFIPFVEPFDTDNNVYRVRLCNYNDFDLNNLVKILFEQSCETAGIKIDSKVRFTSDMTIYRVTVDSLEKLDALGEFEGVYSAEITYPIVATMDILDVDTIVGVKQPEKMEEYPIIGVLDTGIADISYLKPWKEATEHENYPPEYQDNSHGTFVAGIIEYGDELSNKKVSALDGVKLFNAVVHPGNAMTIYPEELIDNVREAVEKNPEIKIWNLSLGTTMECEIDELEKGNFIEMFDFPFPTSLVDENGFFRGQIILTMVNKSLVDDKQAGEYCQSNIDVFFGTYETEKERDVTKPTIKNPRGVDVNQNLLSDSLYSASAKGIHPVTGFERECTLVKYGKKFHPVKKYAIDLADMTPSNRDKWLPSTRKWYLKIEGLYRDFIEKEAVKKDFQLSQEYCMILTIRDPERIAPVYDEVTQQLTTRNFIHHDVRVRNVVHVANE